MKEIGYLLAKIKGKITRNEKETVVKHFRKAGMKIGGGCSIFCNIMPAEPWLVEIGDNVTISGKVTLVTHDNSICKVDSTCPNLFGKIIVGHNCFLGQNSTILYGVELADNVIVAAGSVVTSSFSESNIIIGGNPARKIGTWESFIEKNKQYAMSRVGAREKLEQNPSLLVKRKSKV